MSIAQLIIEQTMDVERLVHWALAEQGLGWSSDRSTSDRLALGTRIDGGGIIASPSISLLDDDDAFVVKAAIDALPAEARGLVLMYGRSGTRPQGADDPMPVPQQLRAKNGQLMWEYADGLERSDRARHVAPEITGPKLDWAAWSREKELVEFARAQWTLWREALTALVEPLNRRMATHSCTGPEAVAEPWLVVERTVLRPEGEAIAAATDAPVELGLVSREEAEARQMTAAERREAANVPIAAQASDWSAPAKPKARRRPRIKPAPTRPVDDTGAKHGRA